MPWKARRRPIDFGPLVVQREAAVGPARDDRDRQVGGDPLGDGDRAGPGAAAAVGLGEGLVQVEVHDVEAHVARPREAHDRVQVGAVVVQRGAHAVHDLGDLGDVLVEDPERVGVRQHQAGDVAVGLAAQVLEVHPAGLVGVELDHLQPGHRDRRRVGAVGGVGRQHLVAALAAVLVVGARQQHAGELALGARAGLQRDVLHARDLRQRALQAPHQLERALRVIGVLQRVQAGVPGQRGGALVQARVVLHRARAERVEAGVEVVVALRDADVVAHELGLGDLGQRRAARSGAGARAAARAGRRRGLRGPGRRTRGARGRPSGRSCAPARCRAARRGRRSCQQLLRRGAGRALGLERRAQHLHEAVDVGPRAPLGERHQQAAAVALEAAERVQCRGRG